MLDMEKGEWSRREKDDAIGGDEGAEAESTMTRVVPFVQDRRNALVLHLLEGGNAQLLASLQYALKRGIEALFQIENRELAAEPLPSALDRRRILFYEASEGGAGVLARLVDDPTALARVAREALAICHFDPDTGADLRRAVGAAEDCEAACYNCLLGYTNQREHDLLDRHRVRDPLLRLAGAQTAVGWGLRDRAGALQALEARCGSELEHRFLRFLDLSYPAGSIYPCVTS